ncbi:MAG: hypothetical protein OXE49_01470 [Gemmatimonadetes bacterium]|nr:hypothetical protein [Gemmatimonadota bacterium]
MAKKVKVLPLSRYSMDKEAKQLAGDGAMVVEKATASDPAIKVYIARGRMRRMRRFAKANGLSLNAVVRIVLHETFAEKAPDFAPTLRGVEEAFVGSTYAETAGEELQRNLKGA